MVVLQGPTYNFPMLPSPTTVLMFFTTHEMPHQVHRGPHSPRKQHMKSLKSSLSHPTMCSCLYDMYTVSIQCVSLYAFEEQGMAMIWCSRQCSLLRTTKARNIISKYHNPNIFVSLLQVVEHMRVHTVAKPFSVVNAIYLPFYCINLSFYGIYLSFFMAQKDSSVK